ncbi:18247_t:CDS:2, partial [Gigaspora margarita]
AKILQTKSTNLHVIQENFQLSMIQESEVNIDPLLQLVTTKSQKQSRKSKFTYGEVLIEWRSKDPKLNTGIIWTSPMGNEINAFFYYSNRIRTFLSEFGNDNTIEHSEAKTEIEQNLQDINYLNLESIVNLNNNAFQDDKSDSKSKESQINLVTDLINKLEDSNTENIGDSLNMKVHMDDNFNEVCEKI